MSNSIREIGENIKNSQNFRGRVSFDEPLCNHTTMKVGGPAALFLEPADALSAAETFLKCFEAGVRVFVLGGGSNIVAPDDGFCGAVISTELMDSVTDEDFVLCCGAGAKIDSVLEYCAQRGIGGLETFAGLPATCGGAAYMNARCYSVDFSELIDRVEYIDLNELSQNSGANVERCVKMYHNTGNGKEWDYKLSPFMGKRTVITRVYLSGKKKDCSEIKAECEKYILDRTQKGHFRAPSAGSVFRNNREFGSPSGVLVDEAGLKGVSVGGAQIAPWHGNFIINTGKATALDIKSLVELAEQKVFERTGFRMVPEIIFL